MDAGGGERCIYPASLRAARLGDYVMDSVVLCLCTSERYGRKLKMGAWY